MKNEKGQMKIMQMSFMIIGVFFFFILVGLFVLGIMFKDIRGGADDLTKDQAISSLEIIAAMPEFSYGARDAMTIDEDKLRVMSGNFGLNYEELLPIASLEVYKVYPKFDKVVKCPLANCNYYDIYDSEQGDVEKVSSYVSICKRVKEFGSVYDKCEVGKIVVGMKLRESEVDDR